MNKKFLAIAILILILIFFIITPPFASAEEFTQQDTTVVAVSAVINSVLLSDDKLTEMDYLLTMTESDYIDGKPIVLITQSDLTIIMTGNSFCSIWFFDTQSLFLDVVDYFTLDSAEALFEIRYRN